LEVPIVFRKSRSCFFEVPIVFWKSQLHISSWRQAVLTWAFTTLYILSCWQRC
jgi:hypothetical protein